MTNAISNRLDVSELDYDGIRNNLKTFLQNQAEFSDYDFEGSGMSVLLDLLAYNTHYLSFNANMLSNELYLDSADIRKNVVALAKQLGYTPTSVTSPMATIDILVNNVPTTTASITMAKGTSFVTSIDGINYEFLTKYGPWVYAIIITFVSLVSIIYLNKLSRYIQLKENSR